MEAEDLDQGLLDHLVVEFLGYGQRAVEFLRSAQALLSAPPPNNPRVPDMIAYCLREAMKAIPASQDTGGGGLWRTTSRAVVDARKRFELTQGLPAEDSDAALRDLLATIDEMASKHDDETIHQRRLIAVIVNRTGAQPLAAGVEPLRAYQQVLSQLDDAVHRGVSLDSVRRMWIECVGLLRQLFLPPEVRSQELDELALLATPHEKDLSKLVTLLAAPNHLHYFLSRLETPAWLEFLTSNSSVLVPPTGQAPWPVFAAVKVLGVQHSSAVAAVLLQMLERWGDNPQQALNVARAAADLAEHGEPVLLQALRRHRTVPAISTLAVFAAGKDYASERFVYEVADIVINPPMWTEQGLYVEPLLDALVKGLNVRNAMERFALLCYKVRKFQRSTGGRYSSYIDYSQTLDDFPDYLRREPFYALMRTLIESLRKALVWFNARELLRMVSELPEDLKGRIRIWILANASRVDGDDLIEAVAQAIQSERPSTDDVRAVERAIAKCSIHEYQETWTRALGPPPTVAELGAALAGNDVPVSWRRTFLWSAVLPAAVTESWSAAIAVMVGAYGQPAPPTPQPSFELHVGSQSPLSEEELRSMPVRDAAQRIAAWRPEPGQVMVTALELARTLEAVVKSDAATWGTSPLMTASLLQQPIYIHYYLSGLANANSLPGVPVAELIDLIVLVRTRPWQPIPLGEDRFDYDPDWRPAEWATIEVIKKMAVLDIGFGDRRDDVWAILRSEIQDRTEPAAISGEGVDPLERAINRPCTRALDAALAFLAYEHRHDATVRPEALDLLALTLEVAGEDGAEYRAILATRIGFLRYIAPHWVEQHRRELFGEAAPNGLGTMTVDLALRWGQPNRWFLENYRSAVEDAVSRGARQSLDHYLVAMINRLPGYAVSDAVRFLRARELLSAAGRTLARLLSADDISADAVQVGVEFWTQAMTGNRPRSLAGFGWFADVSAMETETWLDLTLRTLITSTDSLDWPDKAAERAADGPPTTKTLDILNLLVRGAGDEWERQSIAERAAETLRRAQDLSQSGEYRRLRTTLVERGFL